MNNFCNYCGEGLRSIETNTGIGREIISFSTSGTTYDACKKCDIVFKSESNFSGKTSSEVKYSYTSLKLDYYKFLLKNSTIYFFDEERLNQLDKDIQKCIKIDYKDLYENLSDEKFFDDNSLFFLKELVILIDLVETDKKIHIFQDDKYEPSIENFKKFFEEKEIFKKGKEAENAILKEIDKLKERM